MKVGCSGGQLGQRHGVRGGCWVIEEWLEDGTWWEWEGGVVICRRRDYISLGAKGRGGEDRINSWTPGVDGEGVVLLPQTSNFTTSVTRLVQLTTTGEALIPFDPARLRRNAQLDLNPPVPHYCVTTTRVSSSVPIPSLSPTLQAWTD